MIGVKNRGKRKIIPFHGRFTDLGVPASSLAFDSQASSVFRCRSTIRLSPQPSRI